LVAKRCTDRRCRWRALKVERKMESCELRMKNIKSMIEVGGEVTLGGFTGPVSFLSAVSRRRPRRAFRRVVTLMSH
jgi:hypothetical protein